MSKDTDLFTFVALLVSQHHIVTPPQ